MGIEISEQDLYMFLISETRYALKRNNPLAPATCCELIKKYLPKLANPWQSKTAEQIMTEVIDARATADLDTDILDWEKLIVFLTDFITKLPYNIGAYEKFIYPRLTLKGEPTIDWASPELNKKILYNKNRLLK